MTEREGSPYFLNTEINRENIESIQFVKTTEFPEGAIDVSEAQNGSVMLWYIDSNQNELNEVTIGGIDGVLANEDSSNLFAFMSKINLIDFSEFYTNGVINMEDMFNKTGYYSSTFALDLGDHFNTSDVTNMNSMFSQTGYTNPNFILKLGDKFDTSNVRDMRSMFEFTGVSNPNFTLDLRTLTFNDAVAYTNLLPSFPSNNLLTVKNQTVKDFILTFVRSDLTNVQIAS